MEELLVFDGKGLRTVGIKFFFQHPVITDLKKEEVRELHANTLFYRHELADGIQKTQLDKDIELLDQMILDMYREIGPDIIKLNKLLYV